MAASTALVATPSPTLAAPTAAGAMLASTGRAPLHAATVLVAKFPGGVGTTATGVAAVAILGVVAGAASARMGSTRRPA